MKEQIARFWNNTLTPFSRGVLIGLVAGMALMLLAGCSGGSEAISRATSQNSEYAQEIIDEIVGVKHSSQAIREDPSEANIASHTGQIDAAANRMEDNAKKIIDGGQVVQASLTRVKDIVPWWADVLTTVGTAVIVACVLFFLWRSGLLNWLRRFIGSISTNWVGQARLDLEALEVARQSGGSASAAESAIAARRAASPEYEGAWRRERRRWKLS